MVETYIWVLCWNGNPRVKLCCSLEILMAHNWLNSKQMDEFNPKGKHLLILVANSEFIDNWGLKIFMESVIWYLQNFAREEWQWH